MHCLTLSLLLLTAPIVGGAGLDHFEWSNISSPQRAGQSIGANIIARDSSNLLVSNFTGTVNLTANAGLGLQTSAILGNITYQDFSYLQYGYVSAGFAFTPQTNLVVTHARHYSGGRVSVWTDDGVLLAAREVADFGGTWTETPLLVPIKLLAGKTYRVTLWSGANRYYWRNDSVTNFAHGLIGPSYTASSDVFPTTILSARTWLVDLRYAVGDSNPLALSPPTSLPFVSGISTNSLTVSNGATAVQFRADDGAGHAGVSGPFTVLADNDMSLRVVAAPDKCPLGDPLLYTVVLTNTGPAGATQVTASNQFFGPVQFSSAIPSQGSYSFAGNIVVFNAGTIATGSAATLQLSVVPTNTGLSALHSSAIRGEPDGSYENNASYAVASLIGRPSLTAADVTVSEANTNSVTATLNFNLSLPTAQTVLVNYATSPGSATAGTDFQTNSGVLVFPPGTTNASLGFTVFGDSIIESNEFFVVNLTNVAGATLARGQIKVTISDNETAPTLTISDVSVTEGNSGTTNAVFDVRLTTTNASERVVSVSYATANGTAVSGSDYTTRNGVLTFAPGVTNQTISVPVTGELLGESNEIFFVNLSLATNATIADSQGLGTILNDDPISVGIDDATVSEGNDANYANFRVWISPVTNRSVVVSYSTANGTAIAGQHYAAASGSLVFPAGTSNQTLQVVLFGDLAFDQNKSFFVNLTNPVGGVLFDSQAICIITNNDPAPVARVVSTSIQEGDDGNTNMIFQILLSGETKLPASIKFTTADGSATAGKDYLATNGTLVFPVGTTNLSVSVTVLGDRFVETNETFALSLSSPTNAAIGAQGVGTIINNDGLPGQFHHLEWAAIPSPQVTGMVFTATLTARDLANVVVTNFTGPVMIAALTNSDTATLFLEDFEDGNLDGWSPNFINTYQNITNQTAAMGTNSFYLGTFFSVTRSIANLTPSRINFSVRTGATNAFTGRLEVGSGAGSAAFFSFQNTGQMGLFGEISGQYLAPYQANQWYRISLLFNWDKRSIDYLVNDTVAVTNIPFRALNASGVTNITRLTLDGYAGAAWYDQIEFIGTDMVVAPGALTPEIVGPFSNGVWSGSVAVLKPTPKAMLVATNNDGSEARSNPFAVDLPNDLTVSVTPAGASFYQNTTTSYTVLAHNTGPGGLNSVKVTNTMPAGFSFVSASASLGSWMQSGQQVFWDVGTLPNGTDATLQVTVSGLTPGSWVNAAGGGFNGSDPNLGNNTNAVLAYVLPPLHHFSFAPPGETQQALVPFEITVSARDLNNQIVSNFNGTVSLSASRMFKEDFEDGDTDGWDAATVWWQGQQYRSSLEVVTNPVAAGAHGIAVYYGDVSHPLNGMRPDRLTFRVRLNPASPYCLLTLDGPSGQAIRFLVYNGLMGPISNLGYFTGAPCAGGQWYTVRLDFHWPAQNADYYLNGVLISTNAPFFQTNVDSLSSLALNSGYDNTSWWDEFEFSSQSAIYAASIAPTNSGSFSNGVWTGLVAVDPPGTNVQLSVADTQNHVGLSKPFMVTPGPHGVLDHFGWDPIGSQLVNQAFPVHVTALDAFGALVTNFNSPAVLQARKNQNVRVLVFAGYATTNRVQATLATVQTRFTNFVATITTNLSAEALRLDLKEQDVFLVPVQDSGASVNFGDLGLAWASPLNEFVSRGGIVIACSPQLLNDSGLLASAAFGAGGIFGLTRGTNHILTESLVVPFSAPQTTTLSYFSNTNGTVLIKLASSGEPVVLCRDVGAGHALLFGWDMTTQGTQLDDLLANAVKWAQSVGVGSLEMSPRFTDNCTNGQWQGMVTISNLSASAFLWADDGHLHNGPSQGFSVGAINDVSVASGMTNGIPIVATPLLFQINFTNIGPNVATGVIISNSLPTGTTLLGATSSTGTCTNVGGLIICDIGTLTNGAGGVVSITLSTSSAGLLTNQATISRGEADYYSGNNSTTLIVQVLPPTSFTISGTSVLEPDTGLTNAILEVRLYPPSQQTGSVMYATSDGTAVAGLDYTSTNGVLVFAPGQTNKFITVAVKGELLSEDTEFFNVVLTNPTNALLGTAVATGTILDNADPFPRLAADSASLVEGDNGTNEMTFTVRLAGSSGRAVSVQWGTQDGTATAGADYISAAGVLSFAPGQTNATFKVNVLGDYMNEPDEFFFVNLTNASNSALAYSQTSGFIRNDDAKPGYLDHFNVNLLTSPVVVSQAFWLSVEARDALNFPLGSVNEPYELSALIGQSTNTVNILTWTGLVSSGRYPQILTAMSNGFTGFRETSTTTTDPTLLQALLQDKDVFLIPPQGAPSGYMGTLGAGWSNILNQFVTRGGVLIVCSDNYDEHLLLAKSGFLQLQRLGNDFSGQVTSNAPSRLLEGVSATFSGPFVTRYNATNGLVVLKTVANGSATVIQRELGVGAVFMFGSGFFSPGSQMDRVLANAVRWNRGSGVQLLALASEAPLILTNGAWLGHVTAQASGSRVRLSAYDAMGITGSAPDFDILGDLDGDGMPDSWELANSLNPNDSTDAFTDADGDGMNNLAEFRSGTSPVDAASALRISVTRVDPNLLLLEFFGAAGRRYVIESSDALFPGTWTAYGGVINGSAANVQQYATASPNGTSRLFRVKLLP